MSLFCKNVFNFMWIIGDPSGDGHDKTYKVIIEASVPNGMCKQELIDFLKNDFEKECKEKLGVDIEHMFTEYEEYKFTQEQVDQLKKVFGDKFEFTTEDWISPEDFLTLWMDLVHQVKQEITLTKDDEFPEIYPSGGYGLFE